MLGFVWLRIPEGGRGLGEEGTALRQGGSGDNV